ncbi:MAG: histidine kinase [Humidesulfovibrio sp.]|uniref:histidine kinase n=1 Tax=Humidesulfovibrio sp. TaxID=2910988 RepID=UPI0027F9DD5B|nr:histidine kinase [Humidesulfovibrio sp.]MDQ7834655.1 histidine kinase [Humidesulfovibrio sp.]
MSDALTEEFFAEVSDKYYPQVLEGLGHLSEGDVAGGIEILSRPLHTIKGVTGFMPGFESASSFTHAVESFLKKLQSGSLPHSADNISLAAHGVNSIFAVIEQIRDLGAPDKAEMDAVCEVLEAASGGGAGQAGPAGESCLKVEQVDGRAVVRITTARVHRKHHRDQIVGAIITQPQETPVVLDLTGVKTFGSSAWEDISTLAGHWSISVRGLAGAARETFHASDMDTVLAVMQAEAATGEAS